MDDPSGPELAPAEAEAAPAPSGTYEEPTLFDTAPEDSLFQPPPGAMVRPDWA